MSFLEDMNNFEQATGGYTDSIGEVPDLMTSDEIPDEQAFAIALGGLFRHHSYKSSPHQKPGNGTNLTF